MIALLVSQRQSAIYSSPQLYTGSAPLYGSVWDKLGSFRKLHYFRFQSTVYYISFFGSKPLWSKKCTFGCSKLLVYRYIYKCHTRLYNMYCKYKYIKLIFFFVLMQVLKVIFSQYFMLVSPVASINQISNRFSKTGVPPKM